MLPRDSLEFSIKGYSSGIRHLTSAVSLKTESYRDACKQFEDFESANAQSHPSHFLLEKTWQLVAMLERKFKYDKPALDDLVELHLCQSTGQLACQIARTSCEFLEGELKSQINHTS